MGVNMTGEGVSITGISISLCAWLNVLLFNVKKIF
jgi:hypothetical protein